MIITLCLAYDDHTQCNNQCGDGEIANANHTQCNPYGAVIINV